METLISYTSENLKSEELINPTLVLADFFNDDWLPGHLEQLKTWRDYILKNDFFKGAKNSPAELLYFHKLNVALLEALYLLNERGYSSTTLTDIADLGLERSTWRDYPHNLTDEELLNPFIVIQLCFSTYSLPGYRAHLYEWLEYGLSSSAADEFIETRDLVTIYENLQKLYSAAWLIYQRNTGRPYLKDHLKNRVTTIERLTAVSTDTPVFLYQLNPDISRESEAKLKAIVAIITHKVPTVLAIIYLGAIPCNLDKIFLLVLTDNSETKQASSLSSTIEESVRQLADVTALVHYVSTMFRADEEDNAFFTTALDFPIVYIAHFLSLPPAKPTGCLPLNVNAGFKWERWQNQGKEFLAGAEFYLKNNAFKPALFSLHQCAECLLVAIIRAVLGYRINNHNLSTLLQITQIFTIDLTKLFELHIPENRKLFELLKHAYVNVRYKDTFEPDTKSVAALYQIIKRLETLTAKVYEQHLSITTN